MVGGGGGGDGGFTVLVGVGVVLGHLAIKGLDDTDRRVEEEW